MQKSEKILNAKEWQYEEYCETIQYFQWVIIEESTLIFCGNELPKSYNIEFGFGFQCHIIKTIIDWLYQQILRFVNFGINCTINFNMQSLSQLINILNLIMLGFGRFARSCLPTASTILRGIPKQSYTFSTPKLDTSQTHLQISSMMSKQISVPNSFVLLNIRELLLKSRSDVSGVLEELDALLNSRMMSGIISTSLDLSVECMNLSIQQSNVQRGNRARRMADWRRDEGKEMILD